MKKLVIGVDFGSDSARAIVMNALTGEKLGSSICEYPRWMEGKYSDSSQNIFRQHPSDYLEALENSVKEALKKSGNNAGEYVVGLAVDSTGSTPAPVNNKGVPLALLPEFADNPNAMFYMWKDHSAIEEAKEINHVFSTFGEEDYTRFQGAYSSEWYWAKILHAKNVDIEVTQSAPAWVELSDWIPGLLAGNTNPRTMYRNACAAGHKALWHSDFGGLPSKEILYSIDPYLAEVADNFGGPPRTADAKLGTICTEWAKRLGINTNAVIGGSSFDAHAGAVGAGIKPGVLVKVIGTSTVDMLIAERDVVRGKDIQDVCGQAENSIVPGYIGIESGQAAFGDMFSWFRRVLIWSAKDCINTIDSISEEDKKNIVKAYYNNLISNIEKEASITEEDMSLIAVDWFNGRRYPKSNESVRGILCGMNLGTTATQIYKALAASTVFGSRRIFDSFVAKGIKIDSVIAVGGIAQKSPYIMQLLADVIKRPIMVSKSEQSCAMGAAIYAAVAANIYSSILEAEQYMCDGFVSTYSPNSKNFAKYDLLYQKYLNLGRHEESIQLEEENMSVSH